MPHFDPDPIDLDAPEPTPPPDGWIAPCIVSDHEWELEIVEGEVFLHAKDPCPALKTRQMDPQGGEPVCVQPYWSREDLVMHERLPVAVKHVDDSTPSTPNGPAEYGYYIEIAIDQAAYIKAVIEREGY